MPKLSAKACENLSKPGLYGDGDGLSLKVKASGAKSWLYRYKVGKKVRDMGLGAYPETTLALARQKARDVRQVRAEGVDPVEKRHEAAMAKLIKAAQSVTFKFCAEAYIDTHKASWRNEKHIGQWCSTLESYVYPVFKTVPVNDITTPLVLKALQPIWTTKPETASRVRGRIESILDWSRVAGFRHVQDNPARWRGHLDHLLPKRGILSRGHHKAIPFTAVPALLEKLASVQGVGSKALAFAILTAARTGETIGARWGEFDLDAALWIVPAARMKAAREHRVPLPNAAIAILIEMKALCAAGTQASHRVRDQEYVFPSGSKGRGLSTMALLMAMRRHSDKATVHGCRSAFKDWASETTAFSNEVSEAALAHTVGNKVEAAYRRGDLFDKRRIMMDAWAAFCIPLNLPVDNAVQLRAV